MGFSQVEKDQFEQSVSLSLQIAHLRIDELPPLKEGRVER